MLVNNESILYMHCTVETILRTKLVTYPLAAGWWRRSPGAPGGALGLPTLLTHADAAMSTSGKLTLITGPSGVGKGTLVNQLLKRHPQIWLSVSATSGTSC